MVMISILIFAIYTLIKLILEGKGITLKSLLCKHNYQLFEVIFPFRICTLTKDANTEAWLKCEKCDDNFWWELTDPGMYQQLKGEYAEKMEKTSVGEME